MNRWISATDRGLLAQWWSPFGVSAVFRLFQRHNQSHDWTPPAVRHLSRWSLPARAWWSWSAPALPFQPISRSGFSSHRLLRGIENTENAVSTALRDTSQAVSECVLVAWSAGSAVCLPWARAQRMHQDFSCELARSAGQEDYGDCRSCSLICLLDGLNVFANPTHEKDGFILGQERGVPTSLIGTGNSKPSSIR